MDHLHYEGMTDEASLIKKSLEALGKFGKVRGWLSPAKSESKATLDLLAAEGIEYVCDWVNDDLPYEVKTKNPTYAMPHNDDIADATVLTGMHQDEDELRDQRSTISTCSTPKARRRAGASCRSLCTPG